MQPVMFNHRLAVDHEVGAVVRGNLEFIATSFRSGQLTLEDQAGAVFAINGRVVGMDIFDDAVTFEQFLPKLIQSYAIDALDVRQPNIYDKRESSVRDIRDFIDEASMEAVKIFPAVGLGNDLRLGGERISGGALVVNEAVVHLCAFRLKTISGSGARDFDSGSVAV